MKWYNYFLSGKHSRLTDGHLKAKDLYQKILEHDGSTAYCCYFDLVYESLKLEYWQGAYDGTTGKKIYKYLPQTEPPPDDTYKPEITFTQYEGLARPALNMVSFDFDAEENPQEALDDVRRFVEWLAVEDIAVFFSGSKGFHIMVPFGYFGLAPSVELPRILKDLAKYLEKFYPTLDTSIYNYNRKFRVPFTKHEKTGLYKSYVGWSVLQDTKIEEIKDQAKEVYPCDFLKAIDPEAERDPLEVLTTTLEAAARESYEIEKEKGGSLIKPSNFEKYDGKVCIKKMLDSRCEDVGRNNAALRIVNDYYRTGKTKKKAETAVLEWAKENSLPLAEIATIISNIYECSSNYNFGCQDEIKAAYCSYKCPIYKKLDPTKRPVVVDMPETAFKEMQKKSKPSEFEVVRRVLIEIFGCEWDNTYKKFIGGTILKQGEKDLFFYKVGYWHHLENEALSTIKIKFNGMFDQVLGNRQIENIWKMFLMYVPCRPQGVNMFIPRNNLANFNNGTLHLVSNDNGTYDFEFKVHEKTDYITFKIDLDYDPDATEKAGHFEEWLLERLDNDSEKVKLIQEMYGAALLPSFPQFFCLVGTSRAGKTTVIKVLQRLLGKDSSLFSKVPPHKLNGFHMASMIGKLVNIVTDIKVDAVISDDIVKQVEDRDLMRVERKNKEDLYAPLPALHIFGAQDMPSTLESTSGAMSSRWKIIRFKKTFTGKRNRQIADYLYNKDPQGILNWSIEGLKRIALDNGGFFSEAEESEKEVTKWTKREDNVQFFLDEFTTEGIEVNGDLKKCVINYDNSVKIKRKEIWDIFSQWQEQSVTNFKRIGKKDFFSHLESLNFQTKLTRGHCYFYGLGWQSGVENTPVSDKI